MSQGILSSSYLYPTKFNLPTQNPIFETCSSSYLTFDSHHPTLSFSLKTQSESCRSRPIMACMSSSLYVTAESSLYELLGISEKGTLRDIKQAYKQLVLKYHPDVSPPECVQEYTNRFIRIQEAYETLSDPNSRALYDSDLVRGLHMAFSARKQFHQYKGLDLDVRGEWKRQWQTQLKELKRRRRNRDSRNNMSCGARMRRD
ncbi:hypothetical protein Dsin_030061 [Dipteronia sinensis]|uniref:J domain-containing protein n=1 Tax=Dipteronia sinensis TaxID=43782 RepID=A0AAD9ZJV8_9ROSI|nr:hypothetical protein Dsin_030061 [Dipteronia sinensis]